MIELVSLLGLLAGLTGLWWHVQLRRSRRRVTMTIRANPSPTPRTAREFLNWPQPLAAYCSEFMGETGGGATVLNREAARVHMLSHPIHPAVRDYPE